MQQLNFRLDGKNILIAGLARSGTAAVRLAEAHGAVVTVTDTRPEAELQDSLSRISSSARVIQGKPSLDICQDFDLVVLSPGIPPRQDWIEEAVSAGIEVISEVELAYRMMRGKILGITGTNGKTTTTLLTGAILTAAGIDNEVTGNVGTALSESVLKAGKENRSPVFVTELSSFQLEKTHRFSCAIAMLLNCTPDHLNRYPDFESYRDTKLRIFRNQDENDFAIINADDSVLMEKAGGLGARLFPFSITRPLEQGVFISEGCFLARWQGHDEKLLDAVDIRLKGEHNLENIAAALSASFLAGANPGGMSEAVRNFKGVEHRLEFVSRLNQVDYFNDSKSTTVHSTIRALQSIPGKVILIMGGFDKGDDFTRLKPIVADKVKLLILMGATAGRIETQLDGSSEILRVSGLEKAVSAAAECAAPGDTVLLSPACASYDMFKDYEHRGREFKSLVLSLPPAGNSYISEVSSS